MKKKHLVWIISTIVFTAIIVEAALIDKAKEKEKYADYCKRTFNQYTVIQPNKGGKYFVWRNWWTDERGDTSISRLRLRQNINISITKANMNLMKHYSFDDSCAAKKWIVDNWINRKK